ncbi:hypothetical protein BcDW1_9096 [Botrytis cinerea BcDW1]|uniref:Uncharacterized protein n=1 Tax=Botryotinia fuckeliana (strain BcDW1) TaxID=1290391 RepID=M7U6T5_BOTF1|nr:hypothetical protein BcDW1_9096 [Botrytis cinerea BcDW1]
MLYMISKHHGVVLSVRCQPLSFQYDDRNVWPYQWTVTMKHGEHALLNSHGESNSNMIDRNVWSCTSAVEYIVNRIVDLNERLH